MATRVQVRSSGALYITPDPLVDTSALQLDLSLPAGWQSGTWVRGSTADRVLGAAYVDLDALASGLTGKLFALRVKCGPAIRVRITSQLSGVAIIPCGASLLLSFPTTDLLTLVEVSGDASEATDIVWACVV